MNTKFLILILALSMTGCVKNNDPASFEKDAEDNDSSGLRGIENNRLYSMHDKYHAVTCWYLVDQNNTTMSCLPDDQIENAKKD